MEVHLHRFLDHPNVIKLYDFFEHAQAYVMVLERPMYHKDLFDYITEKRRLEEREAGCIFRQVVEAVLYCEAKGIFHRDIKDENILLDTKTGQVKLLDFGSGTVLENTLYTDYEGEMKRNATNATDGTVGTQMLIHRLKISSVIGEESYLKDFAKRAHGVFRANFKMQSI